MLSILGINHNIYKLCISHTETCMNFSCIRKRVKPSDVYLKERHHKHTFQARHFPKYKLCFKIYLKKTRDILFKIR